MTCLGCNDVMVMNEQSVTAVEKAELMLLFADLK
jgi:hypothetical protein